MDKGKDSVKVVGPGGISGSGASTTKGKGPLGMRQEYKQSGKPGSGKK